MAPQFAVAAKTLEPDARKGVRVIYRAVRIYRGARIGWRSGELAPSRPARHRGWKRDRAAASTPLSRPAGSAPDRSGASRLTRPPGHAGGLAVIAVAIPRGEASGIGGAAVGWFGRRSRNRGRIWGQAQCSPRFARRRKRGRPATLEGWPRSLARSLEAEPRGSTGRRWGWFGRRSRNRRWAARPAPPATSRLPPATSRLPLSAGRLLPPSSGPPTLTCWVTFGNFRGLTVRGSRRSVAAGGPGGPP
jgi:hypothetical protein